MKKQILNEEFLKMQKLAGLITEGQYKARLNEGKLLKEENGVFSSTVCKQIFDACVEQDRKEMKEDPPKNPEVIKTYEQEVQNSKYGNVYDLAQSLDNLFEILTNEYGSDFRDVLMGTKGLCEDLNLYMNDIMEFLQIWLYLHYKDYSEDEQEEEWDEFYEYIR